ncbi:endonuclease domain-containing protein, partial [Pseudomonas sp. OTU5201]|uniref:endonuclease domain-containing protein n=1 Tax=Pseudomonas sp. OTU5201 TaxID=3043850 RepID=UPI00313DC060
MRKPPLDDERLEFTRMLRRSSTDAENLIWRRLRGRQLAGLKFRRQHPAGPYVLDFYCLERLLAVEVDGGQHYSDPHRDQLRDGWLAGQGIQVLRFSAREALVETEAVLERIL